MKYTEIYYLERKNNGNYEHSEMSATAIIDEGEDKIACMLSLKDAVHNALYGTVNKPIIKEEVITPNVGIDSKIATKVKEEIKAEAAATPVKEKKATVKKEKVAEVAVEVVKEVKEKKVVYTKYASTTPEHKSIFGGYLAEKYGESWKTVSPAAEIKAFTASLNGKDFLDTTGKIAPMFLEEVHSFFGYPTNA